MQKCLLSAVILFTLLTTPLFAQHTQHSLVIRDSLYRIKPHENLVQKAYICLEVAALIKNDFPQEAFSNIVSAFRISILEGNDSLKARVRMRLGDNYIERRQFMKAYEHYLAAWKIYHSIRDTTGEISALLKVGIINRDLNNYKDMLGYLQTGLNIVNKNTGTLKGILLEEIGTGYRLMKDDDTALIFYNKALSIFRSVDDKKYISRVKNDIGSIYLDENKNKEGLVYFLELIQETDTSDREILGTLYTRLGHIYDTEKDFRSSLKCNLKALDLRRRDRAPVAVNSSLINVAGDYYNLGKPDSGKIYMDSGFVLAAKFNRKNLLENGYHHLFNYSLRTGDYPTALGCYGRYSSLHSEIQMEKNRNYKELLETNGRLQEIQQAGKMLQKRHNIQTLNSKYHEYLSVILKILLGMAGFSIVVYFFVLIYILRIRGKMQQLNIQLSQEISDSETAEEQTRDREQQYKFLTDNSLDLITQMDDNNVRTYASPASKIVYGYDPEELVLKSAYDLIHPDYYEYAGSHYREMIKTRSSQQLSYQALKKDGTVFWVESILNPLFDPISGTFKGVVGVTRDIQERKNKEFEIMEGTKQKENLLKEIHHRVKNNFAILVSLINMQMAQTKNPELLHSLTNLQLRIRTMALVHEMLYRSGDFEKISFPGYLRSLASVIAGTYNRRDVVLSVEADEVVMDIEASIPLGLIVNEILSNAYKHAFPDNRAGKILLRFSMEPESGINTLTVQDDGIGMPSLSHLDQYTTMGLKVVQILCQQIEGKLMVDNNPGASFTITFQTPVH